MSEKSNESEQLPGILRSERDFSPGGKMAIELSDGRILVSAAASEKGGRETDEDAVYQGIIGHPDNPQGAFYLLADGMGGESNGAEAARLAVTRVGEKLAGCDFAGKNSDETAGDLQRIVREIAPSGKDARKNTTLAMAVVVGDKLYTFGIGDSRVYLKDEKGSLIRATTDGSLVEGLVVNETIKPAGVYAHPNRNIVSASFNSSFVGKEKVRIWNLDRVTAFALACDGVWEGGNPPQHNFYYLDERGQMVLREEEVGTGGYGDGGWIGEALKDNPVEAVGKLTAKEVGHRSGDNVSAIVVSLSSPEEELPTQRVSWREKIRQAVEKAAERIAGGVEVAKTIYRRSREKFEATIGEIKEKGVRRYFEERATRFIETIKKDPKLILWFLGGGTAYWGARAVAIAASLTPLGPLGGIAVGIASKVAIDAAVALSVKRSYGEQIKQATENGVREKLLADGNNRLLAFAAGQATAAILGFTPAGGAFDRLVKDQFSPLITVGAVTAPEAPGVIAKATPKPPLVETPPVVEAPPVMKAPPLAEVTVKTGDTVSEILAGARSDPYGPALTEFIIKNQSVLMEGAGRANDAGAVEAIKTVVANSDWVARGGSRGTWETLMKAARWIFPGQNFVLP